MVNKEPWPGQGTPAKWGDRHEQEGASGDGSMDKGVGQGHARLRAWCAHGSGLKPCHNSPLCRPHVLACLRELGCIEKAAFK